MSEAGAASRRIRDGRSLGLLDGIPVAWKDLFDITGLATTAGSKVLAHTAPALDDADVVSRLKAAGMPVGFLLSALPARDEQLLSAALCAEAVIRGE